MDEDTVSESNLNRQCCALHSTIGQPKAAVMAARVHDIDPSIAVDARAERYEAATRERFFDTEYDYIADCIDLVSCKVDLIRTAHARGIPIVSALGTGNKMDASRFELCDISQTSGCPFARVMRRELRSAGITHHAVVFSPEPAMTPEALCAPPPGRRSVPGSLPWVPASAGLLLAQKIVLDLCAAPEERA
ncbi:thiF family protein [Firmicutes bacterium CAG:103]|nr:thiF family protein [Firmicutes bacterium CAG:103]